MAPAPGRALFAAITLLALLATAGAGTVIATDAPGVLAQQETPTVGNETDTVFHVDLRSDGDARWTVTEHFDVSSPTDRAAFEDLARRFGDGETAQLGLPAFRAAEERVQSAVDREMTIRDVTRATSVENGTLELSFTWTNFARQDNETRIVGDAFRTPGGTWFDGLGPNQTLVVEPPGGSALDTPKEVTDGQLRWEGPTRFEPGYLQITYTASESTSSIPPLLWGLAVAGLVFAFVGVVGGYLLTQRRDGLSFPAGPFGDGDADTAEETPAAEPEPAEPEPDDAEDEEDDVDLSLLSDEERVEYLIEQNGGRMKQANIVKETGWSNAKVSQLLSAMEEEGRIAKLRIGRENLISFPDEDIGEFEDG